MNMWEKLVKVLEHGNTLTWAKRGLGITTTGMISGAGLAIAAPFGFSAVPFFVAGQAAGLLYDLAHHAEKFQSTKKLSLETAELAGDVKKVMGIPETTNQMPHMDFRVPSIPEAFYYNDANNTPQSEFNKFKSNASQFSDDIRRKIPGITEHSTLWWSVMGLSEIAGAIFAVFAANSLYDTWRKNEEPMTIELVYLCLIAVLLIIPFLLIHVRLSGSISKWAHELKAKHSLYDKKRITARDDKLEEIIKKRDASIAARDKTIAERESSIKRHKAAMQQIHSSAQNPPFNVPPLVATHSQTEQGQLDEMVAFTQEVLIKLHTDLSINEDTTKLLRTRAKDGIEIMQQLQSQLNLGDRTTMITMLETIQQQLHQPNSPISIAIQEILGNEPEKLIFFRTKTHELIRSLDEIKRLFLIIASETTF